jgi:hypothetical protein
MMEQVMSPTATSRSSEESNAARSPRPSLHSPRFAKESRHHSGIVMRYYMLVVAFACVFIYRESVIVNSFTFSPWETPQVIRRQLQEQAEFIPFVMPERSGMKYSEFNNMTAAEKVASVYTVQKKTDYDPLANCSVTSQVRIIQRSPQWIMQSIDANGNDKTMGGDEFYVTYTDNKPPQKGEHTAAALIQDLENGSYALDFKTTPMEPNPENLTGVGTLTVHFEYSCNIGRAHPPMKATWTKGGATLIHHSKSNITQPPIRPFKFPPTDIDFSTFDLVVAFGDSMMQTLLREKDYERRYHRENNKTNWHWNPLEELNSVSFDHMIEKLEEWHGVQHLRNSSNVALLLGSSAWDITAQERQRTRRDFRDHLNTCRRFVLEVQSRYPDVTVIWKAPAAMVRTAGLFPSCVCPPSSSKLSEMRSSI